MPGRKFGQRVDLCSRLREVLLNYPEDSLLKEAIQNADDAGATRFCVVLDRRNHSTSSLNDELTALQGPALVTYNDSVFTDKDIDSIQNVGGSRKTEGGAQTGKFGLGFNSSYHVTEVPMILTRGYLMQFDPSQRFLGNGEPGDVYDFGDDPTLVQQHADTFAPFRIFDCEPPTPFQGTIFRLPLRTPELAKASQINNRPFEPTDAMKVLEQFISDLPGVMLFLQSVHTIEVLDWRDGDVAPTKLLEAVVTDEETGNPPERAFLRRLLDGGSKFDEVGEQCFTQRLRFNLTRGAGAEVESALWLIKQKFGGGRALAIALDPKTADSGFLPIPWGGVAARLEHSVGTPSDDGLQGPETKRRKRPVLPVSGQPYCLLPLPQKTGLPVHLNGRFELSTNRRDVWSDGSLLGAGALRAEWNFALLDSVITPTYAQLLAEARDVLADSSAYALWPHERPSERLWQTAVDALCARSQSTQALDGTNRAHPISSEIL